MSELKKNLKQKVQNSIVLKQKLNEEQIQKFLDKVLTLPEEWQEALIKKFTEEETFFEEQKKKQVEIINQYKKELEEEMDKFKKDVRVELENQEDQKDEKIKNELLWELNKI